jgi:hypothetical protein
MTTIYRFKLDKKLYTLHVVTPSGSMCTGCQLQAEPYGWLGETRTKWVRRRIRLDDFDVVAIREKRKIKVVDITRMV